MSSWNFLCCNLSLLPVVLLLYTSRESQVPSSLHHPIGYVWTIAKICLRYLISGCSSHRSLRFSSYDRCLDTFWCFSGLFQCVHVSFVQGAQQWAHHCPCASAELSRGAGSPPSPWWQCSSRGCWHSLPRGSMTGPWEIQNQKPRSLLARPLPLQWPLPHPAVAGVSGWESGHERRHRCTQMSSSDSQYSFYTPIDSSWGTKTLWVSELCIILYWTLQTHNVLTSETAREDTGVIRPTSVLYCVTASKKVLHQTDASPAIWFLILCYWVTCFFFLIAESPLRFLPEIQFNCVFITAFMRNSAKQAENTS